MCCHRLGAPVRRPTPMSFVVRIPAGSVSPWSRLDRPGKAVLTPGLVDRDGCGVGQVQRAPARQHRNAHLPGDVRISQGGLVQAGGFGPEHQHVTGPVADVGEQRRRLRREGEHPRWRQRLPGVRERGMNGDRGQVVVVQPGPSQLVRTGRSRAARPDAVHSRLRRTSGWRCRCWGRYAEIRTAAGTSADHGKAPGARLPACPVTCSVTAVETSAVGCHTRRIASCLRPRPAGWGGRHQGMSRKSMSLSVFRALHKGAAGGTAAAT